MKHFLNQILAGIYSIQLRGGSDAPNLFYSLVARLSLSIPFILFIYTLLGIIELILGNGRITRIPTSTEWAVLAVALITCLLYPVTGSDKNFTQIVLNASEDDLREYSRKYYYILVCMAGLFIIVTIASSPAQ